MSIGEKTSCPICSQPAGHRSYSACHNLNEYRCTICGKYVIVRLHADQLSQLYPNDRPKLMCLMCERSLMGLARPLLHPKGQGPNQEQTSSLSPLAVISIEEMLDKWPATVNDRLMRALCNLSRVAPSLGQAINLDRNRLQAVLLSEDSQGATFVWRTLSEQHWLKDIATSDGGQNIVLTASGWQMVDEYERKRRSPTKPVFVAMWFDSETDGAYTGGMEPAIKKAGYLVTRADREEHNDYIMNKLLGMIRTAPFVVADYTDHRKGVYYEAGFAQGLGLPVINCCRKDHMEKAHFDTKQLNHIVWETAEELRERLYHRIMATIGPGPFFKNENGGQAAGV